MSQLEVSSPQGFSGLLARNGSYAFAYDPRASGDGAVSLTMPVRLQAYESSVVHPVFQMNLPEGFLLERLRNLLAKTSGTDPLFLLALLGGEQGIGRLRYELRGEGLQGKAAGPSRHSTANVEGAGESLSTLLTYRGSEGLFESLLDRYLLRSGLSGVQPKVLVPERTEKGDKKGAVLTAELIVKSGQREYPGLAINEFVCMSAVASAGLPVPEFFLSDDRNLFVMRRFDRSSNGAAIGFEDMAVLAGREASRKYEGSYGLIARLIQLFCAAEAIPAALAQLFDMVTLSCLLGNGDAHLKNFGVLYDDVEKGLVRMAPAYDIVNTTCYLAEDNLALSLAGNRTFFAARQTLLDFALSCNLSKKSAERRILELCDVVARTFAAHRELAAEVNGLSTIIEKNVALYRETFASRSS